MQVTVDKLEGDYLVVELASGEMVNIPKKLVPKAQEGDIIDIKINPEATKKQAQKIKNLMDDLFVD